MLLLLVWFATLAACRTARHGLLMLLLLALLQQLLLLLLCLH
jgi:hypothetical protein